MRKYTQERAFTMSLLNRIKSLAHEQGLTLRDIETKLNLGTRSMQRWDTNSPAANKVLDVANLLHTSVDYLLTGHAPNNTHVDQQIDISGKYNLLSEEDKFKVNSFIEIATLSFTNNRNKFDENENKNIYTLNEPKTSYAYEKYVPILGKVAAGIPITLVESYLDKVAAPSDKVDFATVANGKSMEPVIYDGENIFIKSMQSLDDGDIGIFDINGETTCKRFKYDSSTKTVILTSFNSEFKSLTYPLKNYQDTFRIIGKVILTDEQAHRYHRFIQK